MVRRNVASDVDSEECFGVSIIAPIATQVHPKQPHCMLSIIQLDVREILTIHRAVVPAVQEKIQIRIHLLRIVLVRIHIHQRHSIHICNEHVCRNCPKKQEIKHTGYQPDS